MARSRVLKPGFFKNEDLAALPFETRLCFAGLWTLADRAGRLEDRPLRIKAELFPYDNVDMDAMLSALHSKRFVLRYVTENKRYISILKFTDHQSPHVKESESTIPAPDKNQTSTVLAPDEPDLDRLVTSSLLPSPISISKDPPPAGSRAREQSGHNGGNGSDRRSKRPIFTGQRLTVFEWMFDDCTKTLGPLADDFDLHEWFFSLDSELAKTSVVIPRRDGGAWLQEQLLLEAERRKLPLTTTKTFGVTPKTAGNAAALRRFAARRVT